MSGILGWSQNKPFDVGNPLEVAPALSGNYGELRPNHFHGGLDIKTGGQEGLNVHTVESGYVSRIKISPYGYGKAVYVTHPNGYTTVYGHLRALNDSIARYTKRIQYEQKSFAVDVYPGENDLHVLKGDIIAFSGNTGGSGGPHLHFEVRETETEVPRNPLLFQFPLNDSKRPIIESVAIKPLDRGGNISGSTTGRHYRATANSISSNGAITIEGDFGIEVSGYDQQDGSGNKNGIYKIEAFIDEQRFAAFTADSIPFSQSRFLNALIDYEYYYQKHVRFIRLYRLPGNILENVTYKQNGRLSPEDGGHTIRVIAKDVSGNSSEVEFEVDFKKLADTPEQKQEMIRWNGDYYFETDEHQLHIPKGAIYRDEAANILDGEDFIEVLNSRIPLQKSIQIKIKSTIEQEGELIARVTKDGRPIRALQTRREGEWLIAESRSFGRFGISHDQTKPQIKSVNFRSGSRLSTREVVFQIKDNLSGIESFRVLANNQWILAEYDPKRARLSFFTDDLPKSPEAQELMVEVIDMARNVATFEGTFINP
ncbi:MAG: M23 family metallopeptidase [Flavobacteriales bacterium]|nr:M23 family metallopeptidase [Flavobacteriales bacterium]